MENFLRVCQLASDNDSGKNPLLDVTSHYVNVIVTIVRTPIFHPMDNDSTLRFINNDNKWLVGLVTIIEKDLELSLRPQLLLTIRD